MLRSHVLRLWLSFTLTGAFLVGVSGWSVAASKNNAPQIVVPESVQKAGVIRFVADFAQAPNVYFDDNHAMTGSDYELCNAAAARLGVKAQWTNLQFSGLIPALIAGRFDIICSAMYVTPKRLKAVAFIPYYRTGHSAAVLKGNPHNVHQETDLCGLSVVETLGTVYQDIVQEQNRLCIAQGRPPIDLKMFTTTADTVTQLVEQRADVWMSGDPLVEFYVSKQADILQAAFSGNDPKLIGFAVAPEQSELGKAMSDALTAMKADGSYDAILGKYGLQRGEISTFAFHPVETEPL